MASGGTGPSKRTSPFSGPAGLLNGDGNSAGPSPTDIPSADDALAAAGYTRVTGWKCTDDIWGAVIRRTGEART
jgi:hypothetical protein